MFLSLMFLNIFISKYIFQIIDKICNGNENKVNLLMFIIFIFIFIFMLVNEIYVKKHLNSNLNV